jgi:hypothetical protein
VQSSRGSLATEARDRYQEARGRYLLASPLNAEIMDLNLALVDLAEGDHEVAGRKLAVLVSRFTALGWLPLAALAHGGLAVCAENRGDHDAVQTAISNVMESLGPEGVDSDIVWTLELASTTPTTGGREISAALTELRRRQRERSQ